MNSGNGDLFSIGGQTFPCRLILGTGKFPSNAVMKQALGRSGASMVTVVSATTAAPGAWPDCAERPLGTSTETTRAPEALRHSIQMSKGARGSP